MTSMCHVCAAQMVKLMRQRIIANNSDLEFLNTMHFRRRVLVTGDVDCLSSGDWRLSVCIESWTVLSGHFAKCFKSLLTAGFTCRVGKAPIEPLILLSKWRPTDWSIILWLWGKVCRFWGLRWSHHGDKGQRYSRADSAAIRYCSSNEVIIIPTEIHVFCLRCIGATLSFVSAKL